MSESNNLSDSVEKNENIISDYYTGYQELNLQAAEKKVRKARNTIFVVAGLTIIGNIILMSVSESFTTEGIVITGVIAGIFTGLGFFTQKQPFSAILIALCVYIGLWALDIILAGPQYFFRGIIIKGIIIYLLVSSLKPAREAEQIRKELSKS